MTVRNCRREAVALALASGSTVRSASVACKVAERTIRYWLSLPCFRDRVAEQRGELFSLAVGRLADLSGLATEALRGLLASNSETVRLGAARTVLEHAPRIREAAELAAEVERLKQEMRAVDANSDHSEGSPAAPNCGTRPLHSGSNPEVDER